MSEEIKDITCNMCRHSCKLTENVFGGMLNATVDGGCYSTPGNGFGALDDATTYKFSICEFCLDFIFQQFKIPPECADYLFPETEPDEWKPAEDRVKNEGWRRDKSRFFDEAGKRALSRKEIRNALR